MDKAKLSCTTLTFGGRLPEKLDAMRAAGFGATEFLPKDLFELMEGPEHTLGLLARSGLKLSCYQSLRNFEGMAEADRPRKTAIARLLFEQMKLVGADTLILCSNVAPDSSPDRGRIVADLRELGELAKSYGMRVAWEPLCVARWVRDYREAWEIVRQVDHPNFGLLLDCLHIFALNLPIEPIADIAADKIFLVEVSDIPGGHLDLLQMLRHHRLFPGEGVTPVRDFVRQIRKTGYDGFYAVEVFNTHYRSLPPDEVARMAMASLSALFET